jgi:drug/metabolite transporter (DMT)-like permease
MNPYFELLIVSVIFGLSGSIIKLLHLPSTTLTFFRVAIPTGVLFVYLSYKRIRLFKGNNKMLLIASAINAIRLYIMFAAFNLASIGNATLASATGIVFLSIFSFIFLKERVTRTKIILIVSAFIGLCILYSNQPISFANKDFVGMSLAILSTAMYQSTVIIFKKELHRYSKTETIFYQNVVGTFVFLPFLFINKPFPAIWQIAIASTSGLFIGLIAFILYFSALRKVSPTSASLAMIDTVLSVLFGVWFFHEHLTINMIIGGLLILCTSIFISLEMNRKKNVLPLENE